MAHLTECTYHSGPQPLMPTPPRQLVPLPPLRLNPQEEKIESRMRWRRPDLKHTWLKEIEGAPGTCLYSYVPSSLLFYEILPIGGSCLRPCRKNVVDKQSFSNHTRPAQLKFISTDYKMLHLFWQCTSNNACRARPTHRTSFLSCSGGDEMYEIVKDIKREGPAYPTHARHTHRSPPKTRRNILAPAWLDLKAKKCSLGSTDSCTMTQSEIGERGAKAPL